jgi:acyl dehydratase
MPIQELIGKEIPPFEFPVERGKIKEFAEAIGDDNPIYRDPTYAQKKGRGQVIAPPTFTATKSFWRTGGTNAEIAGLDNRFLLHGEEEYEYFQPILAGDVLTCKGKITEAYEKAGKRGGTMTFVVFEFTFFNQKGEKVLVNRRTLIQTGGVVKA